MYLVLQLIPRRMVKVRPLKKLCGRQGGGSKMLAFFKKRALSNAYIGDDIQRIRISENSNIRHRGAISMLILSNTFSPTHFLEVNHTRRQVAHVDIFGEYFRIRFLASQRKMRGGRTYARPTAEPCEAFGLAGGGGSPPQLARQSPFFKVLSRS